jgi:hypothetical protein
MSKQKKTNGECRVCVRVRARPISKSPFGGQTPGKAKGEIPSSQLMMGRWSECERWGSRFRVASPPLSTA